MKPLNSSWWHWDYMPYSPQVNHKVRKRMETEDIHCRVSSSLKRDLQKMAKTQGRSLSGMIKWILAETVKKAGK
jgi:predicted HicB family RNase H-like nuclease